MSRDEIVARLGEPVGEFAQDGSMMQVRKEVDWILDYDIDGAWDDGARLTVEMSKGRLVYVEGYRKKLFAADIGEEPLFHLDGGGQSREWPEAEVLVPSDELDPHGSDWRV